jgi:RimJ/RimL family protein N-acetyltransferase
MIRQAGIKDLAEIMPIYESARRFMCSRGNTNQWINGYPSEETVYKDIESKHCFVCTDANGKILFVFAFIIGEDPTYKNIEGAWLNDNPYGTIHRIASTGTTTGAFRKSLDYCLSRINNIRIDTHKDNAPMLRAIEHAGFKRCGIIYVANGTPREAFQYEQHDL